MRYGKWGVSFSHEETREAGEIARRLGGYEEMLRLERELAGFQRQGIDVCMVLDADGRRQLVPTERPIPVASRPAATPDAAGGASRLSRLLARFWRT